MSCDSRLILFQGCYTRCAHHTDHVVQSQPKAARRLEHPQYQTHNQASYTYRRLTLASLRFLPADRDRAQF